MVIGNEKTKLKLLFDEKFNRNDELIDSLSCKRESFGFTD